MSGYNLPDGLSRADMAHIYGDDGGYSDWVHDNFEELEREFLEEGWDDREVNDHTQRWTFWLENRWEKKCAEAGHFDE